MKSNVFASIDHKAGIISSVLINIVL